MSESSSFRVPVPTTRRQARGVQARGVQARGVLAGVAALTAVTVAATAGASGADAAGSPALKPITEAKIRAALAPLVAADVPGAVAQVDQGRGPARAAAGLADTDPREDAVPQAQSRVGSITKSFVATVALQLVGEGRLRLDTPIGDLVPGVPNADTITLRMLMNHTSGLFNYTEDDPFVLTLLTDPTRHWTPAELLAVAASHEPLFAPGTDWHYSNTNFVVVGMILEKVTGKPLETLIADRIVTPLGLRDTYLATTADFTGPHLHGIIPPGPLGPDPVDTTDWTPSWAWAAGALVSTSADLQTFYRALLRGTLLRSRELQAMRTLVPVVPGFGYGLGLYSTDFGCGTVWGHDGGMPGYVTVAGLSRDARQAAVLLTNADSSINPAAAATVSYGYQALSCLAASMPVPPMPEPSTQPSTQPTPEPTVTQGSTSRVPRAALRERGLAARVDLLPAPAVAGR
ncbi:MAG: serine hydrolase domain-containing protein [Kineosporiaceae bacterium]